MRVSLTFLLPPEHSLQQDHGEQAINIIKSYITMQCNIYHKCENYESLGYEGTKGLKVVISETNRFQYDIA